MAEEGEDPVEVLLVSLEGLEPECYLDGDDRPCLGVMLGEGRKEWRMCGAAGKPSEQMRAFLRTRYRLAADKAGHLGDADLRLALDYLIGRAFEGGRRKARTGAGKRGDYNFEAVVAFAGSLTVESAGVTIDRKTGRLRYHARTEDLWRAISDGAVEAQVSAPRGTLCRTLNWFSRRLTELKDHFRREGLDVTVSRKADGSWVTIVRDDDVFHPGPVLVAPDDKRPSSSSVPSGDKANGGNGLEDTEGTRMEVETENKEGNR